MNNTDEARSGRSLVVPLMAGLLGAGLALLFAPRSGKETRQMLRTRAKDAKQLTEDSMNEVRQSLDRSISEARDLKDRLSSTLSNAAKKAKEEMKETGQGGGGQEGQKPSDQQSPVLSTWEEEV